METSVILKDLREKHKLTQEELAERVLVTRQAVSRWETGETMPNTETLKLLSREYDVSINTLLGSPRQLLCQCCKSYIFFHDIAKILSLYEIHYYTI